MTFGVGLSAGLKALAAARLGIETVGQNVANVNTEGYSRQRVLQAASLPFTTAKGFQVGTGVDILDISRIADEGLNRRIRLQFSLFGSAQVDYNRWREIESVFNEPNGGLSKNFSDFFGSVKKLQTDPANRALRGGMVQGARALTDGFNQLATRFKEIESSSFNEIKAHLRTINQKSKNISDLNRQIIALEANGGTANDLRDSRGRLLKDVARLMDAQVLERESGSVDVLIGGQLIVSGTRSAELSASLSSTGTTEIFVEGSKESVKLSTGVVAALLRHEKSEVPQILSRLDKVAKSLALELNRIHSTGVPSSGSYSSLRAANSVVDSNGSGTLGDELLSESGLPFDIVDGELYIAVTDKSTGAITRTRINVRPKEMTLQDLAATLSSVERITGSVDPTGRLKVTAESGFGFDFSTRLDSKPNTLGTFGGNHPVLGSTQGGPYNLSVPSSMTVTVNGTPTVVSFSAGQFKNPAQASASEVADAINSALGTDAEAKVVGDRFVIRSATSGSSSTLAIANTTGTPMVALSLPTSPASTSGSNEEGVEVTVSGSYSGSENGFLTFVPDGDGRIGVTDGLTVGVFDKDGRRVATIDAGPKTELLDEEGVEILDGIRVKMTPGNISQSDGDAFAVDTLADSDTSDVLVAVGLNSFLLGSSASDLRVNPDLESTPALLAASLSGSAGNAGNLERMLDLRDGKLSGLEGNTIEDFYSTIVGDVGFDSGGAKVILTAEDELLGALESQREAISGVNLDEEMVNLVKYQQAFQAASRFINIVNDLTTELINIAR